jgi:hypothetical protein
MSNDENGSPPAPTEPPSQPPPHSPYSHMPAWVHFEDKWPYAELAPHSQRGTPVPTFVTAQPQQYEVTMQTSATAHSIVTAALTVEGHAPTVTEAPPVRLVRPPAGRLISKLERLMPAAAFNAMVAPYFAQEQHEYYEALKRKDYHQARRIEIRMHLTVWYNVICAVLESRLVRWWRRLS